MLATEDRPVNKAGAGISRRERRKLEVQARIAEAAMSLMESKGCEATTVEDICEQADIARKTFYNHYSSKQELIDHLCDELLFTPNEHLLQAIYDQDLNLLESLRVYMANIAEGLSGYAEIDRLLIREAMVGANVGSRAETHLVHSVSLFHKMIERAQQRGEVSNKLSAQFYAEVIVSAINGIMIHWANVAEYPLRERVQELTQYLLFSVCEHKQK